MNYFGKSTLHLMNKHGTHQLGFLYICLASDNKDFISSIRLALVCNHFGFFFIPALDGGEPGSACTCSLPEAVRSLLC